MSEFSNHSDAQFALDFDVEVGEEHIGEVYAEALLGAAKDAGQTESILEEFGSLITDVLASFPRFEEILVSELISHDEKCDILDRIFGPRASLLLLNFLKVVSRHNRLECLQVIYCQARKLYDKSCGRVRVRLTTPTVVDDALAQRIGQSLREVIGGQPIVETAIDPALIGGAVLRIGDTVYDGSIATQLYNLRQQMIDRSVHEIQSRRDRFRYPEGN